MKIATWNVERLKHKSAIDEILLACEQAVPDILVLTETDSRLHPIFRYCFQTPPPANIQPELYAPTENRVSIYTNFPCIKQYPTYDQYTSLCVEVGTERGSLIVYGTIIGIYGNRDSSFNPDLLSQLADIERLAASGSNLCMCGDFNCSFADNYYFTNFARTSLLQSFAQNQIELLSQDIPECIDHIAISKSFVSDAAIQISEWNYDKRLSDHKGIMATISKQS